MKTEEILYELLMNYKEMNDRIDQLNGKLDAGLFKEDEEYIDVKGVALITGFAVQTIYDLKNKDEIPFFKLGNRLRFKKSEVIQWMLNRNELKN